ncbi:MAG: metal-binding protein [Butyrivibrio sp.]|nr:metal-binding protein [Butyrivibrio sp.]MBP3198239.1 metal-binding protein [Butyrivibrio sp.]
MENSSRFFANRDCEYYPCHHMDGDINCLFCYCPLYNMECPGEYRMVERRGHIVKSCIDCSFPHRPENYDVIMGLLKEHIFWL